MSLTLLTEYGAAHDVHMALFREVLVEVSQVLTEEQELSLLKPW